MTEKEEEKEEKEKEEKEEKGGKNQVHTRQTGPWTRNNLMYSNIMPWQKTKTGWQR